METAIPMETITKIARRMRSGMGGLAMRNASDGGNTSQENSTTQKRSHLPRQKEGAAGLEVPLRGGL